MPSYYTTTKVEAPVAMETLRRWFPDGCADDLNFVLFSTSGVHGTYRTIEEAERGDKGSEITFLVIRPRVVQTFWGVCLPQTPEDFAFLRQLRASSKQVLATL